jgi:hypothetical protein
MKSKSGEWFIRTDDGQPHLVGWMQSALKTEPTGTLDTGWLRYGICPRCFAVVLTEDAPHDNAYGDCRSRHERWHAATDYPVPPELIAESRE